MNAGWVKKAWAVGEVTLAFAIMHLAFRTFKRFTELGQAENDSGLNFSPGIAMIVVAVAFIVLRGRGLAACGLRVRPFAASLNAALLCLLLLAACGAVVFGCGAPIERPPVSLAGALGPASVSVAGTVLLLWSLRRFGPAIERTPRWIGLCVLIGLPLLPIVVAALQHRAFGHEALSIFWLLAGAGVGEEVFFRGYAQSRLNEAFGRSWHVFGVQFGPGLFIAAAFFGLVHVLNGVNYFAGIYHFLWWQGLATALTLFYGFLRERYGSVTAPAIVHGLGDLLMRMPQLLG